MEYWPMGLAARGGSGQKPASHFLLSRIRILLQLFLNLLKLVSFFFILSHWVGSLPTWEGSGNMLGSFICFRGFCLGDFFVCLFFVFVFVCCFCMIHANARPKENPGKKRKNADSKISKSPNINHAKNVLFKSMVKARHCLHSFTQCSVVTTKHSRWIFHIFNLRTSCASTLPIYGWDHAITSRLHQSCHGNMFVRYSWCVGNLLTAMEAISLKTNKQKKGKGILQVPDTGTWVLDNTTPFWCSSIVCFWIPPTCSKERKYHYFGQFWYTRNVPIFTNTGTFQYLGPEVYVFKKKKLYELHKKFMACNWWILYHVT